MRTRSRRKKQQSGHNVWRSYSDLMAGLLLLFVLVMCVSFMQAQQNYQDRLASEAASQLTESQLNAQLAAQQEELDEQSALLASQQEDLDEQSALVASQQASLDSQSALLAQQESELAEQSALVASQQASLEEQQVRIEQIVGVRADLIAALKEEFDALDLGVAIDETDGSIILDSSVLFGYNENELTEEGNAILSEVLPVYCGVLTSDEYIDYLAEIRIDGYTDPSGTYEYNLNLSQERAQAVAEYLFLMEGDSISESEMTEIRGLLSVNGHSYSNPVYNDDGEIDEEASRRVEVKFRLKDEEMINELRDILEEGEASD